jgi:mono/diheme cytochrome c family protein
VHSKLRTSRAIRVTSSAAAMLLLAGVPQLKAENPESSQAQGPQWGKVAVELPTSRVLFPPGEGAELANSQCLRCHSADMVFLQPSRTRAEWKATIDKMRSAYGAPLPAEQVDTLAAYLSGLKLGDKVR